MAPKKKVEGSLLQIEAVTNPAPPVGPALGQHGVNIMDFCKAYNAATEDKRGQVIPVEITVYEDRSFDFVLRPASRQVDLEGCRCSEGFGTPHTVKAVHLQRPGP